jgi:hypothetical protein
MPYLIESQLLKSTHYSPCDDLTFALKLAAFTIKTWIWGSRCDPDLAEQLMALIDAEKNREALEMWNARYLDWYVSIHEFEFVNKDCQHDPPEPEHSTIYYLVEVLFEYYENHMPINSREDAFKYVRRYLKNWTGNTPITDQPCSEATRTQIRSLLKQRRYADAIDTWNSGVSEAKIVIHKIRLVKTIL